MSIVYCITVTKFLTILVSADLRAKIFPFSRESSSWASLSLSKVSGVSQAKSEGFGSFIVRAKVRNFLFTLHLQSNWDVEINWLFNAPYA